MDLRMRDAVDEDIDRARRAVRALERPGLRVDEGREIDAGDVAFDVQAGGGECLGRGGLLGLGGLDGLGRMGGRAGRSE
jgi:hypothetical protein